MKRHAKPVNTTRATRAAELRSRAEAELQELGTKKRRRPTMHKLYLDAETRLQEQRRNHRLKPGEANAAGDTGGLLHELQVHQVELELQNAELEDTRDRLEVLLEKYTDLYDFAPSGYFTLAADGTIQMVNLTGSHMVGVERSRLVGQSLAGLVPPERRRAFSSFLNRVFGSLTKHSIDFELRRPGRPPRTLSIEGRRLPNDQACRAVLMDITARRQAEDQVRVSEVRYRRLFEAAHDGVLLLDPGTCKITDANPFMTKLLGYPQDQLIGKELFEIGLLEDEAVSQEMFRKLKQEHHVRYEDLPLKSQEGRRQEVEVVAKLYQENDHAVIQCNIRDITQRKQAEEELRRNEALFSTLIEEAPYGMYLVDANFRLQQVNRKARPVFRNVHPLIGRELAGVLRILWPRRVADEIISRFRHTLKTGEPYLSPSFAARRRDTNREEIYEWQIQRVTLAVGAHAVVAYFNNITERKRAEETQHRMAMLTVSNRKLEQEIVRRQAVETSLRKSEQQSRALLAQSRQMQEQLRQLSRRILSAQEDERKRISRELHDVIAQTLAGINVRLTALKKDAVLDIKSFDRFIVRTQTLVEHSVNVVHRFARELRPTVLDDLGLIPALQTFLKALREEAGLCVSLSAFAAVEKVSDDKRTVLFRVAQEALNNVVRHARAGRVGVVIQDLDGEVCLEIKDDGRGFSQEKILRSKRNERLGLIGMRERLETVGGRFNVMSVPGLGTTVLARIPLDDIQPAGREVRHRTATTSMPDK